MEIRELRNKTNLSQSEFANKFGIPVRTLQKWEQNAADPLPYLMALIQDEIEEDEFIRVEQYLFIPKETFKVTRKRRFLNIEKVHPIQQENIEKILDELKKYDEVKRVVVFGSSVTSRCTYESDIDIYVELNKDKNVKTFNVDTPIDFWTNYNVEPSMLEEIQKKGVVVYDCK